MYKIILLPHNQLIITRGQATLLDILVANQVPIGHSCAGDAVCGWCKVRVVSGLETCTPPTGDEQYLRRTRKMADDERLACQIWVESDMTISTDYW